MRSESATAANSASSTPEKLVAAKGNITGAYLRRHQSSSHNEGGRLKAEIEAHRLRKGTSTSPAIS
jgi:hypothetical protein